MDARSVSFQTCTNADQSSEGRVPETGLAQPVVQKAHPKHPRRRHFGREAVKSGLAASLAVSVLTGLKILRPMSLHPVASWVFIGLAVLHTLVYEMPKHRHQKQ